MVQVLGMFDFRVHNYILVCVRSARNYTRKIVFKRMELLTRLVLFVDFVSNAIFILLLGCWRLFIFLGWFWVLMCLRFGIFGGGGL